MTDRDPHAGGFHGVQRANRRGAIEAEGFFAKDMLAGLGCRDDLTLVQRMRRRQDHSVNAGVSDHRFETAREFDAVFGGEGATRFIVNIEKPDDIDPCAVLERLRKDSAPPA